MCNINLIYKKNGEVDSRISVLMNTISYNSFLTNNQGEGYMLMNEKNELIIGRSSNKIIYNQECKFLASHQRLATSGRNNDNIHPFREGDIVLMHNGIISGIGDDKKCDSKIYAEMLAKEYDSTDDLKKAVKRLTISGSYSIMIYDLKNERIIYYKNPSTNMYYVMDKEWVIMSTSEDNVRYAKLFLGIDSKVKEVIPYKIFDVSNMNVIGEIKKKNEKVTVKSEYQQYLFKDYDFRNYNSYDDENKYDEYDRYFRDEFGGSVYAYPSKGIVSVVIHSDYEKKFKNTFKEFKMITTYKEYFIVEVNESDIDFEIQMIKYYEDEKFDWDRLF